MKACGSILIPNTPYDVSFVPVYGIKREFTKHWFCEFTIGGGVGKIKLRYYAGCPKEERVPDMSGKIVEKEYLIIARENNDRGGWL